MLDWLLTQATKYEPLIKTGVAALSTYASFKDQQKKNQMQQDAYDDYMAQAEAAGHEARAAIDINYTPMTVSGVPTSKADVTDFTAVAARGGLMSIPNTQRKRYARGPDIEDIEVMDEEVFSPGDFKMETGVDVTGEQVFHDTGNPRTNAQNVWSSGAIDQEIYQMDFEIFFQSGDWQDHISQAPATGEGTQMASHEGNDAFLENRYQELLELGLSPAEAGAQAEKDLSSGNFQGPMATGGIAGLRHGGRPGYAFGPGPVVDQETMAESITLPDGGEEVVTDSMTEIEGQTAGGGARGWKAQMLAEDLAQEQYGKEFYDLSDSQQHEIYTIALDMIDTRGMAQGGRIGYSQGSWESEWEELYQNYKLKQIELGQEFVSKEEFIEQYQNNMATGGRIKKDNGGIMNLGGLEKDYRTTGGFVPIGAYEKKDDVPARLSKNEFVMTADAVRAAGGGSINKGAQLMYDTMKHLEASPGSKRMTA